MDITTKEFETIKLTRAKEDSRIAILTINRPRMLNALNQTVLREMREVVRALRPDNSLRILIIIGEGDRGFASGADINELVDLKVEDAYYYSRNGQTLYNAIANLNMVAIACVNGWALGGGCELAMACDIRYASANVHFGVPEVSLGVIPGYGGTQRLARLIGVGRAKEMLFTAEPIDAKRAFEVGLVNKVFDSRDELLAGGIDLAQRILKNSMYAVRMAKRACTEGLEMELNRAIEHEVSLFSTTYASEDSHAGVTAFLNKEKAHFEP